MPTRKLNHSLDSFRKKVKYLMEEQNIGVRPLARAADISPGFLSYILNGKRNPSDDMIKSIAKALNVSPDELLIEAGYIPTQKEEVKFFLRASKDLTDEQLKKINEQVRKYLSKK